MCKSHEFGKGSLLGVPKYVQSNSICQANHEVWEPRLARAARAEAEDRAGPKPSKRFMLTNSKGGKVPIRAFCLVDLRRIPTQRSEVLPSTGLACFKAEYR
jgi:hypothetical protein